jgi:hypothetical protein
MSIYDRYNNPVLHRPVEPKGYRGRGRRCRRR